MTKEMRIRLAERMRVYKDSPAITATYVDLVHIIEDLIEIHQSNEDIGFKKSTV